MSLMAALQLTLGALSMPGIPCPVLDLFHKPCPGCGLTRATLALFSGDLETMAQFHLFAPVLVVGLALVVAAATLPDRARDRLVRAVTAFDRNSRPALALGVAVLVYWAYRVWTSDADLYRLLTS